MEPPQTPASGGYLLQQIGDFGRKIGQPSCSGFVLRELKIAPQVAQDFSQVGLARPVKAGHPDGGLFRMIQIGKVGAENFFQTLGILPLAHEGLEFEPESLQLLRRDCIFHDCNAVVEQLEALGVG